MGMSGDLAVAVEEGSTEVRIGTALFGPRPLGPDPAGSPVRLSTSSVVRAASLRHAGGMHVTLEEDHGLPGSGSRRRLRRLRRLRRAGSPAGAWSRGRSACRVVVGCRPGLGTRGGADRSPGLGPAQLPLPRLRRIVIAPVRRHRWRRQRPLRRLRCPHPTQPHSVQSAQRAGRIHGAAHGSSPSFRPGPGGRRQVQGRPAGHHEPRGHRTRRRPAAHRLRQRHLLRPRRLDGEGRHRRLPAQATRQRAPRYDDYDD
jgi:hypothetical protein